MCHNHKLGLNSWLKTLSGWNVPPEHAAEYKPQTEKFTSNTKGMLGKSQSIPKENGDIRKVRWRRHFRLNEVPLQWCLRCPRFSAPAHLRSLADTQTAPCTVSSWALEKAEQKTPVQSTSLLGGARMCMSACTGCCFSSFNQELDSARGPVPELGQARDKLRRKVGKWEDNHEP